MSLRTCRCMLESVISAARFEVCVVREACQKSARQVRRELKLTPSAAFAELFVPDLAPDANSLVRRIVERKQLDGRCRGEASKRYQNSLFWVRFRRGSIG